MLDKLVAFYKDGITVTPERYSQLKKAHAGLMKVGDLAGEVLEEMAPDDETPFQFTGAEGVEKLFAKLGDKLGNG